MKFQEWFNKKLKVTRYPLPEEIKKSGVKYVINVSCEYIAANQIACMNNGIKYFWFPMDEFGSDIGLNSIFGALQILWIAEHNNDSVILHCHAGANRSPTVQEAYYYLRAKEHFIRKSDPVEEEVFSKMFPEFDYLLSNRNRLLNNIKAGHLPCISKMEKFLKEAEKWFLKQDWDGDFKTESGLNSIKLEAAL